MAFTIENCRQLWESDEHWALRREFLEKYQEDFDEDRLLCLAQVYANVELLNCSYPDPIMRQIHDLARDMTMNKGLIDARTKRISVHFVSEKRKQKNDAKDDVTSDSKFVDFSNKPSTSFHDAPIMENEYQINKTRPNIAALDFVRKKFNIPVNDLYTTKKICATNFAIMDFSEIREIQNASSTLQCTSNFCSKQFVHEYQCIGDKVKCEITMDGENLGEGIADGKDSAKKLAAEKALSKLSSRFYTIKVKKNAQPSIIARNQMLGVIAADDHLPESNVGLQMLKRMGWDGGAIGKNGITEPISCERKHSLGNGLGFEIDEANSKQFKLKIEQLLRDYSRSNTTSDLLFSTDFSKEERKTIHLIASKYWLKSGSHGKEQRQLTISRRFKPEELINYLLQSGGSSTKYKLIAPTNAS